MVFTELIINQTTNKLIAAQEFEVDRGKDHDWSLSLGQIFERIDTALTEELQRYIWNPVLKRLEFDPAIKTIKEMETERLDATKQTWDQQQTQLTNATSVDEIKSIVRDILGPRPTEEIE